MINDYPHAAPVHNAGRNTKALTLCTVPHFVMNRVVMNRHVGVEMHATGAGLGPLFFLIFVIMRVEISLKDIDYRPCAGVELAVLLLVQRGDCRPKE
ncbi:MAG: hypothetical protein HPY85_17115 [Anaerolineae bacterium]|nr:hypothetical protein [Anaerolineae bacterium]